MLTAFIEATAHGTPQSAITHFICTSLAVFDFPESKDFGQRLQRNANFATYIDS